MRVYQKIILWLFDHCVSDDYYSELADEAKRSCMEKNGLTTDDEYFEFIQDEDTEREDRAYAQGMNDAYEKMAEDGLI